jgi:hypothetical protein
LTRIDLANLLAQPLQQPYVARSRRGANELRHPRAVKLFEATLQEEKKTDAALRRYCRTEESWSLDLFSA